MAFLLILDREHKALWVKTKDSSENDSWFLPEVEDLLNKPSNRLNVELLVKQAFIPLKSVLIGQKTIIDIFRNEQQLYLFLCLGKESTEILFDLTKYKNIQWLPINFTVEEEFFADLTGKSILDAYHDILLTELKERKSRFHIVKNGYSKSDIEGYNREILQSKQKVSVDLKDHYDLFRQPIPEIGDYALLNNWKGLPLATFEITGVTIDSFENIADHIKESDEQQRHPTQKIIEQYEKTFLKWSKKNNKQFSADKPVVISQFKIIKQFEERKREYLDLK